MFDDLDPDFISSPGAALPIVAARVRAVRMRHRLIAAAVLGTGAVVVLGSIVFSGGGGKPDRLTVARATTTTSDDSNSTHSPFPLITSPTTASASTSTTAAATSTTATQPVASDTTSTTPGSTTTTEPAPAHFVVTFDRDRLVIKSGTAMTISATVTNDGGQPGRFGYFLQACVPHFVWPDDQSFAHPVGWPVPSLPPVCIPGPATATIPPGSSAAVPVNVDTRIAVEHSDLSFDVLPAAPGDTTLVVKNEDRDPQVQARLPVTITPPDSLPLTIDHPSEVTTASGAHNSVNFTITNNLPFPVTYFEQGPCVQGGDDDCEATAPHSPRDLRHRPYDKAELPLWRTKFVLQANETRNVTANVDGVVDLDRNSGSADLPPGIYHFFWDGEKVKLTVT